MVSSQPKPTQKVEERRKFGSVRRNIVAMVPTTAMTRSDSRQRVRRLERELREADEQRGDEGDDDQEGQALALSTRTTRSRDVASSRVTTARTQRAAAISSSQAEGDEAGDGRRATEEPLADAPGGWTE